MLIGRPTIEDVEVATKIYKCPSWRYPATYGYPRDTYECAAWVTAGVVIFLPENPLGIGILKHSFPRLPYKKYSKQLDDAVPTNHSAWADLTLNYGLPGMFFLCDSLILYCAIIRNQSRVLNGLMVMMSIALLLIYCVGGVAVGHGLESRSIG